MDDEKDSPTSISWVDEPTQSDSEPISADPTPEVTEEPVFVAPPAEEEPVFSDAPPAADFVPEENFGEVPVASSNETTISHPLLGDDWNFNAPDAEIQLYIQEAMTLLEVYRGPTNGKFGNFSVDGIQQIVREVAPRGWVFVSGRPDFDLCLYIQQYAVANGGYNGFTEGTAQPGILDEGAWICFANALGQKVG